MGNFTILTYNSTGLGACKRKFITEILSEINPGLVLLQETWLLNSSLGILGNIHKDYLFCGTSGVPDGQLLQGRPYGGVAILWRKDIAQYVKVIRNIKCTRICAVELETENRPMILVNTYFPVDNRRKNHVDEDFLSCMDAVEQLMENYPHHVIVIGGDLNCDMRRRNAHDMYLTNFCNDKVMRDVWSLDHVSEADTYIDIANNSSSCLDHFIASESLVPEILDCQVLDYAENMSNHQPVKLSLSISVGRCQSISQKEDVSKRKIAWHKVHTNPALVEDYQQKLELLLPNDSYDAVRSCRDVNCNNAMHERLIDQWCEHIVECCLGASEHLPSVRQNNGTRSRCIPGWNKYVKPLQEENKHWHGLWIQSGRPRSGTTYECMKYARNQYRYAIRRVKRNERTIRLEQLAEAASCDNSRDFFTEVKKLKPKNASAPNVNDLTNSKDIANHFAEKYQSLYNKHVVDHNYIDQVKQYIADGLQDCLLENVYFKKPVQVTSLMSYKTSGKISQMVMLVSVPAISKSEDII